MMNVRYETVIDVIRRILCAIYLDAVGEKAEDRYSSNNDSHSKKRGKECSLPLNQYCMPYGEIAPDSLHEYVIGGELLA